MLCSYCHQENPSTSAFCSACGAAMEGALAAAVPGGVAPDEARPVRCPRCQAGNRVNMRFCKECGTPLDSAGQSPSKQPQAVSSRPVAVAAVAAPRPVASLPACTRCGAAGEANSRFCKYCGAPFESGNRVAVSAAPPAAAVAAPQPVVSRRPPPATSRALRAQVVVILRNGSEGRVYPLTAAQTDIGSSEGEIVLPDDPFLSPRHARIERRGDSFWLRDMDSVNGIYLRLQGPADIGDGDMILVGQQVLRFRVLSEEERQVGPARQQGVMIFGTPELRRVAKLVQYTTEGLERDVHHICREETVLGREQADMVFPDDPFLSRRHAAIAMSKDQRRFTLRDLGSSNGTALRCRGERALQPGDQFRLGRHLFRFDLEYGEREDLNLQ